MCTGGIVRQMNDWKQRVRTESRVNSIDAGFENDLVQPAHPLCDDFTNRRPVKLRGIQ